MIQYLYLGRVAYDDALRLQAELVEQRQLGRIGNVLLLLEHPPVLTLGRNANRANVLASDELLAARGVTLHEINRGGDVTYHGPGQLIGYPIFDLRSLRNPATGSRLGPVDFVRLMEEALIRVCGEFGVPAGRICKLTGVWSHGFAFNITTDLRDFLLIHPCGITDRPVTSLAREVTQPETLPSLEVIAHQAARQFGAVLEQPVVAVESLHALGVLAGKRETESGDLQHFPARAPEFPAEDTPLKVPAEIERQQHRSERPVRA